MSKQKDFVAWDGEGTDYKGKHRYMMLCNSEDASIINREGLSTMEILAWLDKQAKYFQNTINVMYGMSYDVNMLVHDMDKESVRELWTRGWVRYNGYRIGYKHRKELTIARYANPPFSKTGKGFKANYLWRLHFWDVHSFFQCSFVQAMKQYLPEYSPTVMQFIGESKEKRGKEEWLYTPQMREYCVQECIALVCLCDKLREHLSTAGLLVQRWDGAGAVASAILRKQKIKPHMPAYSDELERLATIAYSGGRIEAMQYGNYQKPVHVYDLRSAYPSVIRSLPSLKSGEWVRTPIFLKDSFALWHVKWSTTDTICPLFYRTKQGRIYYPPAGEGWYFTPEVQAAQLLMQGKVEILEGMLWVPDETYYPMHQMIEDMYEQRAKWKAEGNGAQMVLKLGMNSLYGKMVQQVGAVAGKRPPYHNLLWGGYITSRVRATLYAAMMQHPESILYCATDGIASTVPLNLPQSTALGGWEYTQYDGVVLVQAGVYFLRKDGRYVDHYRGFDRGTIEPHAVVKAWKEGKKSLHARCTRFVGMGAALASLDYASNWCEWVTMERELTLYPAGKRVCVAGNGNAHKGLCRTLPSQPVDALLLPSHPYDLGWVQAAPLQTLANTEIGLGDD